MKVFVLTDSRGQHIPKKESANLPYAGLLNNSNVFDFDVYSCPFKWTTILDFFKFYNQYNLKKHYDAFLIYCGVVDWSPRPCSMVRRIYMQGDQEIDFHAMSKFKNVEYKEKIENNKKSLFDEIFGEKLILSHLKNTLQVEYEGELTNNLYSIKMFEDFLLPRLIDIENLFFVNSNRVVENWNGDYPRKRPLNINHINSYIDLVSDQFPKSRLIDLGCWAPGDIIKYTCDNMHLNRLGHQFLYDETLRYLLDSEISKKRVYFDTWSLKKDSSKKKNTKKYIHPYNRFISAYGVEELNSLKCLPDVRYEVNGEKYSQNIFCDILAKYSSFATLNELEKIKESCVETPLDEEQNKKLLSQFLNGGWKSFLHKRQTMKKNLDPIYRKLRIIDLDFPFVYLSEFSKGKVSSPVTIYRQEQPAVKVIEDKQQHIDDEINELNKETEITFIYCVKDRRKRTLLSLTTLNNSYMQCTGSVTASVIIAEDISRDMIAREELLSFGFDLKHHQVDTGVKWTRAGLLNEGLVLAKTPVVCFVDSDTLFPENFFDKIREHLPFINTKKNVLAVNMFETHPHLKDGIVHPSITPYSYMWIVNTECAKNVGGYNDLFTGWGSEDRDFQERLEGSGLTVINSYSLDLDFFVFHFSHNTRTGIENRHKNKKLLKGLSDQKRFQSDINASLNVGILNSHDILSLYRKHESYDGLPCKNTLIVIGNGPSLKNIDFDLLRGYDTFCLNSFYRYFDEYQFFPTYFGCFDKLVTKNHSKEFQDLLQQQSPIKKFFFLEKFDDPFKKLHHVQYDPVEFENQKKRQYLASSLDDFWIYENSGASAVHAGVAMGYKTIILIGVDCNYVQVVEGAARHKGKKNELIIKNQLEVNPNYWRDDYQRPGDIYHTPDAHKFQKPEWERLAFNWRADPRRDHLNIINASSETTLTCFPRQPAARLFRKLINAPEKCTAVIKATGRHDFTIRLVSSIRGIHATMPIIVLDDSGNCIETLREQLQDVVNIKIIVPNEIDIGLSQGRNILLEHVETDYFVLLDDDFLFQDGDAFLKALHTLMSSDVDIIGGAVFDVGINALKKDQPRTFWGDLNIINMQELHIDAVQIPQRSTTEGVPLCDLVMNFFVAKTKKVKEVGWNPRLKLGEHLDFFIRAKSKGLKISYFSDWEISHHRDLELVCDSYKNRRANAVFYHEIFKKFHGINKIYQHNKEIDG